MQPAVVCKKFLAIFAVSIWELQQLAKFPSEISVFILKEKWHSLKELNRDNLDTGEDELGDTKHADKVTICKCN